MLSIYIYGERERCINWCTVTGDAMSVDDSDHLENSGPNSQEEREMELRWLPSVVLVFHH